MSILLICLPLLSACLAGLLGRRLGAQGSHWLAVLLMVATCLVGISSAWDVLGGSNSTVVCVPWISSGLLTVNWSVAVDPLVLSMLAPVLLISTCVHVYSIGYMSGDPHPQRFFSYLGLFTASMVLLVMSTSLTQLFIGWEAIGVSSYLLIGYWFTRLGASQSALKAFVTNRVGDVALSIAVAGCFALVGTTTFSSLLALTPISNHWTMIGLCLVAAASAKSAQLGLHSWLPDAMEGPTPVSALIHAATLVTAGVYLLIRLSPLLEASSTTLLVTGLLGSITALFAGTVGLVQTDVKRVIAFSTCSQMGYLFLSVGLSQYAGALMHLINHACFKALLFLAAGSVLHSFADQQDLRRMGGLLFYLPLTHLAILGGSLSLMALPAFTGYFSKELILELAFGQYTVQGHLLYALGAVAAGITGCYSTRLLALCFYGQASGRQADYRHSAEAGLTLALPLVLLLVFSVAYGYCAKDAYVGLGSGLLSHVVSGDASIVDAELCMSPVQKAVPLALTLIGGGLGLLTSPQGVIPSGRVFSFLAYKWYWDVLFTSLGRLCQQGGLTISKVLDRGLIETVGGHGVSMLLTNHSHNITTTSDLSRYALVMVLGVLILIVPLSNLPLDTNVLLVGITLASLA